MKLQKTIFLALFSILSFSAFAESENTILSKVSSSTENTVKAEQKVFESDLLKDSLMMGSAVTLAGTGVLLDKVLKINSEEYDGIPLNKEDINPFDRLIVNPYSRVLDLAGTGLEATALLIPAVCAFAPTNEWLTIGIMYAESLVFAYGTKSILKVAVNRARPYMYNDGYPQKDVDEGDWKNSFPSGHTTMAFTGAGFASYVFANYFPESPWKWAVIGGSYAVAFSTAALRLASGNHFMTDVITGAAIGTACGILVPLAHKTKITNRTKDNNFDIAFNGSGLNFELNL